MKTSGQRQFALIGSLSLTALLTGAVVGGLVTWRSVNRQIRDASFLKRQLASLGPAADEADHGPAPALVRVDVAERKVIQPTRSIVGRLIEVRKVTVASEVTGKIVEMPVEEGTPVAVGETLLARIDDVWCRLALQRSEAHIASTQAKLDFQVVELKRQRDLMQKNAVSQSELESTQATVDELQAVLKEAEAAAEEQRERVVRADILAPFDGTVVAKHAEVGGLVSPGTPLVEIVSRGQVDASLMVPESMINRIAVGQEMPVRVDVFGEEFSGEVVSVTPYGPTASRTFPVRVRLDDQAGRLKIGMSVTASVCSGSRRESLVVPKDAVLVRPDGSTVWVAFVSDHDELAEVQPVPVTVTARIPGEYALEPETDPGKRLLTPGAAVVVEGAERLTPGQEVRIVTLARSPGAETEASDSPHETPLTAPTQRAGAASARREG